MADKKTAIKNPFGLKINRDADLDIFKNENSSYDLGNHSGINFGSPQPVFDDYQSQPVDQNPNSYNQQSNFSSQNRSNNQPPFEASSSSYKKGNVPFQPNNAFNNPARNNGMAVNPNQGFGMNSAPTYANPSQNFIPGNISLIGQPSYNPNPSNYQDQSGDVDEVPLLEDLGIDIENIKNKTLSVLAFKECDERFLSEADMSGPLFFALAFGCLLMLSGKIHFGYIYGFGVCGCFGIYVIMNLLSQVKHLQLYNTVSILGYCLLPIVILSAISIFLSLKGVIGVVLAFGAMSWATYTATYFFQKTLELSHQKWIVAYPVCLFYSTFILITIF